MLHSLVTNLEDLWGWVENRAKEWTTYLGVGIIAFSKVAPTYAQFDPQIARVGLIAGTIAILFRQKTGG